MTAWILVGILPEHVFTSALQILTTRPVNLAKVVIVTYGSSGPTCINHARDDDPRIYADDCHTPRQYDKFNSGPNINAVRYKPPELCDKQLSLPQRPKTIRRNFEDQLARKTYHARPVSSVQQQIHRHPCTVRKPVRRSSWGDWGGAAQKQTREDG